MLALIGSLAGFGVVACLVIIGKVSQVGWKQSRLNDFIYIIELNRDCLFYDFNQPFEMPGYGLAFKSVTVPMGVYELISTAARDKHSQYWWALPGRDLGISPFDLNLLITNGGAVWLKKPNQAH